MDRPLDINLRDISKLDEGDVRTEALGDVPKDGGNSSKDLALGTLVGWLAGVALVKIGKVAAFGLGARSGLQLTTLPSPEQVERPIRPPTDPNVPPKPPELFKSTEEQGFTEKPAFLPPKPIPHVSHSPKISPSSIPNPNPSVMTTKSMESGYPNYGSYLYSIPGYSAFQPISYPGMMQPSPAPIKTNETSSSDFVPFPSILKETAEEKSVEVKSTESRPKELPKPQTDFEEQFTPEIIPAVSIPDVNKTQVSESKMSIASLTQGSGATVTIPSQITNKDANKKKIAERFSLKTSIPISKIDMKCVNNPPEHQTTGTKKVPITFNPAFQTQKADNARVEIQSNIIIKNALKEFENKDTKQSPTSSSNINTLINAAEAINKSDSQFLNSEPKQEATNEIKDPPPNFTPPAPVPTTRPMFNPINLDSNKVNFANKPPDGTFGEQKNQILFIQNKSPSNPKMLLTIQQQNPQVLLQRTNFDSKNLQAPSRLSSQSKKSKEDLVENGMSSKVVALKRLHQENCDENDFENLITENQIYGNKIVVKEKSQGTQQEQDLKNKNKIIDKTAETKNVVLQPNFLYLSNVQFPNLMMIKNNAKLNQTTDSSKVNKTIGNENKVTNEVSTMTNSHDVKTNNNNTKTHNVTASKEIHVLKSSNNVLPNKNSSTDLVFQTSHQKVIMNPQIVYQVPMIVDTESKLNQPYLNRDYPKLITQSKKEYPKPFEQSQSNDKLFIACPYQMDSKLKPKIVITNIRSKITRVEEVSSLDVYEKRKRMRRLKYLSSRDPKDNLKVESKKLPDKVDSQKNIITPDRMKAEIYKEFANSKLTINESSSESDSDYGEEEISEYKTLIEEYGASSENFTEKTEFLANFKLATHDVYKDKELDRQERMLRRDPVASAYIAAGRLDRLAKDDSAANGGPTTVVKIEKCKVTEKVKIEKCQVTEKENGVITQKKQLFLTQLKLCHVTSQFKEDYEKTWQEILRERKRRNGKTEPDRTLKQPKLETENIDLDTNNQLQILTEIKKHVTDNNNLIKQRLDSVDENTDDGDSIRTLAEKNFSELDRLSKMADRSVKLITGQRDLNPGFDSENIKKPATQPFQYPQINIPNISKIISLKSRELSMTSPTTAQMSSTQATSMDEPKNSAAGVTEMFEERANGEKTKEVGCQVEQEFVWPGWETVLRSYKEFDAARKREISDLHHRNASLRVEGANSSRAAANSAERARTLLAERNARAAEEDAARLALQKLLRAVDVVRNWT